MFIKNGNVFQEDGSYKVDVADIPEDGTTLVMKPDNGAEQATEYTLTIKKVTAIPMEVKLDPENAQFCLCKDGRTG